MDAFVVQFVWDIGFNIYVCLCFLCYTWPWQWDTYLVKVRLGSDSHLLKQGGDHLIGGRGVFSDRGSIFAIQR